MVDMWRKERGGEMKREPLFTSSPIILNHDLTFMISFTLNYFVRGAISNIATLGVIASICEFQNWGAQNSLHNPTTWASLVAQMIKESTCDMGDPGSTLGLGRSPGEGNASPLQYSYLENSMDRGTWKATVQGIAKELDVTEHARTDCLCQISRLTSPPSLHSWKRPTPASVSRDSWSSFLVFELLSPWLVLVNVVCLPGDIFLF